jgi:hypothetical protein
MADIDFGLAYEFVDPSDGVPSRVSVRTPTPGDPRIFDSTGQLVATVADGHRADNGHELPISRPDVQLADIQLPNDGWDE